jgi:hypothetical protein
MEIVMTTKECWREKTIETLDEITRSDIIAMFQGKIPGIRVPKSVSQQRCEVAVDRIRGTHDGRRYLGNLNIGTLLSIPSHWEMGYINASEKAWFEYSRRTSYFTKLRRQPFAGMPDPYDEITRALGRAWGSPLTRLRHPRYGFRLHAGLIRSGAPRLHFDWAPFDLGAHDIVLQGGANLYLANFREGGHLKNYRRYGMNPGATAGSGEKVIGNYGLSDEMVAGAESATIECGVGDFVLCPNRFLHEVTPGSEPEENRIVLSFHVGLLSNGTLAVFS